MLEDPQLPQAVRGIIAAREDVKFVENLLQKTGPRLSRSVSKTLVRFDSFAWAKPDHKVFKQLDGTAQFNAVQMLMASSMDREALFRMLKFLLSSGKPGGRRAAAEHLAQFEGSEADALAVEGLRDRDPGVRAATTHDPGRHHRPAHRSPTTGRRPAGHRQARPRQRHAARDGR